MTRRLVLLHGLGDDPTAWDASLACLRSAGTPEVLTLPGFGGTAPTAARAEQVAEHLWEVAGGSDGVVLIGHSAGGVLATLMAAIRPERVAGLVNVEGRLAADDSSSFSARAVGAPDFDEWFEGFVSGRSGRYRAALERCSPASFRALAEDLVRLSGAAGVATTTYLSLQVPKLFCLGGSYSPASRPRTGRRADCRLR